MVTRVPTRMITTTGVTAGSYTAADITVNEAGQITSAASNSVVVSGGGGPKITGVVVTDNAWTVLDDTAVDVLGGYIRITGTGFNTGCLVYFNQTPASSVSFISSTELRVTTGALTAGTYVVYAINTDGGVAISVPGVTFSASPSWQTASSLSDQYDGVAITLSLVATEATSYTLVSGSLPPGLSLNASTGAITGTVTGVTVDTTYTFTVRATDAQNQDSPRTFTVTITVSDPYFNRTTLLLSGSALTTNTVLRDSSTNNFNLTAYGDARASNFTPYGTGWSVYFDGTDDFITAPANAAFDFGTNDFTIECWIYYPVSPPSGTGYDYIWGVGANNTNGLGLYIQGGVIKIWNGSSILTTSSNILSSVWYHITTVRTSSVLTVYLNGISIGTVSLSSNLSGGSSTGFYIASWNNIDVEDFTGYISNFRVVKGTAVYTANFTPATTNLTAVANTSLLTCNANRFLDSSTNNFTITRNGDAKVTSFNPFNITNTGVNGSMYFDGTGDYLTVAGNSGFAFGTGDFTIECWVNPDLINTATFDRICATSNYNGTGFDLTLNNGAAGLFLAGTSYGISSIPIKAWSHLVYTRSGTTVRGFLNGKLSSHTTGASQDISSTATLFIAHQGHAAGGSMLTGYLADLRIIKGSIPAAYQTASTTVGTQIFTPPTLALTAITNTQLLTLQFDQPHNNHTFLDSSSNQFLITRNGNATQGTFSPFSQAGWSMFVGGAGYQRWDTNTNYSGTDLTIECWAYAVATTSTFTSLVSSNLGTGNYNQYFNLAIDGSNRLICNFYGTGNVTCNNAASFPLNTWIHCAVVLTSAGAVSLYQAGQRVATASSASIASISTGIQVGGLVQTSGGGYTAYFNGYISNARIVKSAVYSGTTITVPTTALSAIANTNLLVCGENRAVDKANGYALGVNTVSRTAVAFSPFAATAVYTTAAVGGSGYFDGSGDYLNTASDAAFTLGSSGDFTVEMFFYAPAAQATNAILISTQNNGSSDFVNRWGIQFATSTTLGWYNDAGSNGITSGTVVLSQWNHIAVCRSGSTIRMWLNGVSQGTQTTNQAYTTQGSVKVGFLIGLPAFSGYISNVRVVKGTAVYDASSSANITVPTAPLTATTNTSLLLNFTDAAILDSTGRNAIETAGDAKTSSVVTKFTGGSMPFDGAGDYVKITPNYLTGIGTADFTIEGWWYFLDFTTRTTYFQRFWSFGTGLANHVTLNIDNSGYPVYRNNDSVLITASAALSLSTWTHVALVRYNGITRIYINGTDRGNTTTNNDLSSRATNIFYIGSESDGAGGYFYGYVSDFRITRYARYTGNFTAPTAPARLK